MLDQVTASKLESVEKIGIIKILHAAIVITAVQYTSRVCVHPHLLNLVKWEDSLEALRVLLK